MHDSALQHSNGLQRHVNFQVNTRFRAGLRRVDDNGLGDQVILVYNAKGFIADGLFIGQQRSKEFQDLILDMAAEADAARREFDE